MVLQRVNPGMDGVETTKDLSRDQRHNQIVKDGMKEKLDLGGKLVVVTVTELGKSMLAGKQLTRRPLSDSFAP
jgi:hypothetical protein